MTSFIIFALNTNMTNHNEFEFVKRVVGNSAMRCTGMYKGVAENSYKIDVTKINDMEELHLLLESFGNGGHGQECILYVNSRGESHLCFQENGYKFCGTYIGIFTQVDFDVALNEDAYTLLNNKFYICE
ncbi:MAG: hypothetical protein MJH10_11500 [Epibacterium sp.]|nr:hypothetical protein [Epibacterium sp.]NQX74172.1 hypothetical protein [Epibacterium sp.]